MGKVVGTGAMTLLFAVAAFAQDAAVTCEALDDGIEKIRCTLAVARMDEAREATFYWHSDAFPQDDRERTLSLPANHGSVYDYRYLRGRAQGIWTVTVTLTGQDGTETEASCRFRLDDGEVISR